ncbi:MAG: hypothetical protein FWC56_02090, partial [Phycisphaerae bacterium]|nr:hypothetical protein [Phycisphaerae bacterium]
MFVMMTAHVQAELIIAPGTMNVYAGKNGTTGTKQYDTTITGLTGLTVCEGANNDFSAGASTVTISAPTGFEFNTGASITVTPASTSLTLNTPGGVSAGGGNPVNIPMTKTSITINIRSSNTSVAESFTISGIQMMATNTIQSSIVSGNTPTINLTYGSKTYPLVNVTVLPGPCVDNFFVASDQTTADSGYGVAFTVTARDVSGNAIVNYDPAVENRGFGKNGAAVILTFANAMPSQFVLSGPDSPAWGGKLIDNGNGTATWPISAGPWGNDGKLHFILANYSLGSIRVTAQHYPANKSEPTVSNMIMVTWYAGNTPSDYVLDGGAGAMNCSAIMAIKLRDGNGNGVEGHTLTLAKAIGAGSATMMPIAGGVTNRYGEARFRISYANSAIVTDARFQATDRTASPPRLLAVSGPQTFYLSDITPPVITPELYYINSTQYDSISAADLMAKLKLLNNDSQNSFVNPRPVVDNCDPAPQMVIEAPQMDSFPLGTYTLTIRAMDTSGNASRGDIQVSIVQGIPSPSSPSNPPGNGDEQVLPSTPPELPPNNSNNGSSSSG